MDKMCFPSDGIKSRTIRRFEQLTEIEFQFDFLISTFLLLRNLIHG